jgi:hypothetical protein
MLRFEFAREFQAGGGVGIEFSDRAPKGEELSGGDKVLLPIVKTDRQSALA